MVAVQEWIAGFSEAIRQAFGNRVVFIGLQGSYGRGEASESSDLDVVVVLDRLGMPELERYENAIHALPHRDKICGFVCGEEELVNWERSDLFQLYFDTEPIFSSLDVLLPFTEEEAKRSLQIGACNIYHACCHNILHEKSVQILKECYKTSVFALRAKCYLLTGTFYKKRSDLFEKLPDPEKKILELSQEAKETLHIEKKRFDQLSEALLLWSGRVIAEIGGQNEKDPGRL